MQRGSRRKASEPKVCWPVRAILLTVLRGPYCRVQASILSYAASHSEATNLRWRAVTDKMDDKKAAADLVIQGFEQVTETQRQIFLNYDFVVRSQNAERLVDNVPIGLENVPRFGWHFVKLVTDS